MAANSPVLNQRNNPSQESQNIISPEKLINNLSLIQEKQEDNSNNVSLINNNYKIIRKKKAKILVGKRGDHDLNIKLKKALNDFKDWKDTFLKDKETPIKTASSFGGLYSPSNRLKTAPYQPKTTFGNAMGSPTINKNFKTIYNGIPNSPNPSERGKKGDFKFTIDVNGVPHSIKMSGTETTGRVML